MKINSILISLILFSWVLRAQQNIGDFISVEPLPQSSDFVIPATHIFQKIIEKGDTLTQGGYLPGRTDFTGYVPIDGSSELGYLSINSETTPGGVSILDININPSTRLWETTFSQAVDFSGVAGTAKNCSGTVTPWNTIVSCEESRTTSDTNGDGYNDIGWCIEINPSNKNVIDKRWALGHLSHENIVVHNNQRTVYQGADSNPGYLFKFVADTAQDLSSGNLYVYNGLKDGPGDWIQINNSTPVERNTTMAQSFNAGATIFNGIEDVEIGPNGWVYFAVKGENQVYRFQDSDPVTGTTVLSMETYVGNTTYNITHSNGTSNVVWGTGNDNLAFDGDGNLWVLQDGGLNYIWVVENGHTQTLPKVKIFGRTPNGSEPTGITFTPDYRYLFMSIQHPNGSNSSSSQTDAAGNSVAFDKDISLVISRCLTYGDTSITIACDSFTWQDNSYTESGTFTRVLVNAAGCDSIVTLNLSITNSTPGIDVITACDSLAWVDGNTYTADNNSATYTLSNAAGCDSVVTLNLNIVNSTFGTDNITSCDSHTWIDGNTYTTDNTTAIHTLSNAAGCDSLVMLNLMIDTIDTSVTLTGSTLSANQTGANYQWLDCENSISIISGEINQSYTASSDGNYAVELTENGCTDTSACFFITIVQVIENSLNQEFKIYPNPTKGEITIDFETIQQDFTLRLISLTGQLIETRQIAQSNRIELEIEEAYGIYLIEIIDSLGRKVVLKIIKE